MAAVQTAAGDQLGTLHASGLVVLVVRDRASRNRYAELLTNLGFTVHSAGDGETGLNLLREGCPKLLILDTSLPDADGIEICRDARELHGDQLSIVFISESDDLRFAENCLQAGGNDYIFVSNDDSKFSQCAIFWATARPIHRRQKHRNRTLAAIRAAAHDRERTDGDDDAVSPLSSHSDSDVAMMTGIIQRARNAVDSTFGGTVEEKLCLLGYVTGIVDHWATIQSHVMTHRADYLRAALRETEIVSSREIGEMLAAWDALAQLPAFSDAVKRGTRDAIACEVNGRRYCPTGLTLIEPNKFGGAELDEFKRNLSVGVTPTRPAGAATSDGERHPPAARPKKRLRVS